VSSGPSFDIKAPGPVRLEGQRSRTCSRDRGPWVLNVEIVGWYHTMQRKALLSNLTKRNPSSKSFVLQSESTQHNGGVKENRISLQSRSVVFSAYKPTLINVGHHEDRKRVPSFSPKWKKERVMASGPPYSVRFDYFLSCQERRRQKTPRPCLPS